MTSELQKLPQTGLTEPEMSVFNEATTAMKYEYNRFGKVQVITDKQLAYLRKFVQNFKKEEDNVMFQGLNPISGIGVRYPQVEDLVGATSTEWDANWGTAGWYNLISTTAIGTVALGTAVASTLQDSSVIKWAFVQYGIRSLHLSPKSKMLAMWNNEVPMAIQNVEYALRASELKISMFDVPIYVPKGGRLLELNLTRTTGNDVLVPWGTTILNSRRSMLTTFTRSS